MGLVRSMCLLASCHAPLVGPDLSGPARGRGWPEHPDRPQVRYEGALELPQGRLRRPIGLACVGDRLAVADPDAGAVWVFDLQRGRVRARLLAGRAWDTPVAVALDPPDLWVVDAGSGAVYVGSVDGAPRFEQVASPELVRPAAVAVTPRGGVVVADTGGHALLVLEGDALVPLELHSDSGRGLHYPVAVVGQGNGALLVADAVGAAVHRVDGGRLEVVVPPMQGYGGAGLVRPKGLALDELGRVHVVDAAMQHVQVYSPEGLLLGRYAGPGEGPESLALPAGICISDPHVFVADSLRHRIQVYELQEEVE